eukprot:symbB.v1.2.010276.t1/scaffold619.1/size180033/12
MGEVWRVRGKGSFPSLKVALSDGSGEILWPLPAFFVQAYGQTQRQPLKVLDKSEGPIRQTYQEIVGSEAPPMLADISSKPSRLDVQLALDEASRPNADIDDPDEIPEVTTSRKRKASSESAVSESNKKHKSVSGTSSTSSSSSSSGVKKDVKAEDKKATAKASSAKAGSPKSSGVKKGPVVKLLDTSHITTSGKGWHQSTKDEVDMAARNSSAKAAKAKAKTGTAAAKKAVKTKTHK